MSYNLEMTVNGKRRALLIDERCSLLEVLRADLQLTGTKEGCAVGECGACTVIVDGETVDACIYLAAWANGREITTIEGIASPEGSLSDIQRNFIDAGAVQCGYCIPGMVVSTKALLDHTPAPNRAEIRRGLSGNLCRCTGYTKIVDAVERTAAGRAKV